MSYDEQRISDQIDGGLHHEKTNVLTLELNKQVTSKISDWKEHSEVGLCLNCEKQPATRGIGETKTVCSKCWNSMFKHNKKLDQ